jgi:hypothetical protein
VVCTGTSKQRWISWTSPHWELLIDMQSKLSRNSSNRVSGSSGLKICHNRSMEKETLTHRMKDISTRKANLKRASPRQERRVTRSLRKTPESGVSSTKSPGTTPMNVARNNHWWSSSKKKNQNLTQTLIQSTIKGNNHRCRTHCYHHATTIQPEEPEELEEGEHLFHSQMWVKGTPLHFIVDNGSQKNLISVEVVKRLKLSNDATPPTIHHQMVESGMRHLCQPTVSHVLWHQSLQG